MQNFMRLRWLSILVLSVLMAGGGTGLAIDQEQPVAQTLKTGLVAHYNFDTGKGDVLPDASGNENNGKIHGATWVTSPRGQALHFDGVDDYVDCGSAENLNIRGDFTLTAWVRAEDVSGRCKIIFGDAAKLTLDRNYNLTIDKERLRFEYGSGRKGESVISNAITILGEKPFPSGSWQFIALVFEGTRYFVYQNDRIILEGQANFPPTPTQGASRRIGGWFAGWFKGDIDEIRLYRRALGNGEIRELFGQPFAGDVPLSVKPRLHTSKQEVMIEALALGNCPAGADAEIIVRDVTRNEQVAQAKVSMEETRAGSGRYQCLTTLPTAKWLGGEHEVTVVVRDVGGKIFGRGAAKFPHSPEKPAWIGSRAGITGKVPLPFTALQSAKTAQGCTVSPWGRTYEFGATPFLSQINSQAAPLLAAPMRLLARVNGADVVWTPGVSQLAGSGDSACRISQKLEATSVRADVTTTIECDGLAKISWSLQADKPVALEKLAIEIPLRSEHARYLNTWPDVTSGALTADFASAFQPIVWLGDDDRGLQWVCESEQNWSVAEPGRAIQIIRRGDEVVLRLNLVTTPVKLAVGTKRDYVFGLQASPVKPITANAWDLRIINSGHYGNELDLPDKQVNGKPALQDFAEKGARAILVWRIWDAFAYPLPIGHEEKFRRLVKECHRYGLKVIPYVGGFLLSEMAPEAPLFGGEMRVHPSEPYRGTASEKTAKRWLGYKPQNCIFACQRGPWQDFIADGIARLITEYDVDGVYLDTTTVPFPCRNELHGCGFAKANGERGVVYPIFSVRDNMRRIYNAVRERKPDGIVDLHVYDCMNLPALAWATDYWNGEQLVKQEFQSDALPLDRFRTEFMGRNWGVPADLLNYKLGALRPSLAISLLHDVPVRSGPATALWKVRDDFGVKQARWLPYWSNQDVVKVETKDCYVSLFAHPDGRVLVYVSNLGKAAADVRLSLNLDKLALPANVSAKDAISKAAVKMENGVITINIPAQDYRIIWVEADPAKAKP
jgi:hypothetical protein